MQPGNSDGVAPSLPWGLPVALGGKGAGLLFDIGHAGPQRLADLCTQGKFPGFMDSLQLHLALLPGMHAGMLADSLLCVLYLHLGRAG